MTGKAKAKRGQTSRHASARTAAPTTAAADSSTVTVRQIENGYLIERSGSRRGKYFSKQVYSKTDPLKPSKVTRAIGGKS